MTTLEKKQMLLNYKKILNSPYKKGEYTWYEATFKDLYELKSFLESDPLINYECFSNLQSQIESQEQQFYGMPYSQALKYLSGGYKENLDKMFELKEELRKGIIFPSAGRKTIKSFTGSRICPNSFVTNNPKRYYMQTKVGEKRFITIHVNMSFSANQNINQILNKGAILYNLIEILEKNNFIVSLNTFFLIKQDEELIYIKIKLKDANNLLSVSNSIFPLTSASFFRRIIFRVMESMPVENTHWGDYYGEIISEQDMKRLLHIPSQDIFLGSPKTMGIEGKNLMEDAKNFLEYIDMDKYVRVKVK